MTLDKLALVACVVGVVANALAGNWLALTWSLTATVLAYRLFKQGIPR
jgi:hypothetical protein